MQLVFNWHITDRCNYSCHYCFASWNKGKEICHEPKKVDILLSELAKADILPELQPITGNSTSSIRINFVGGEPLFFGNKTVAIVKRTVNEFGFTASVVTNAFYIEKHIEIVDDLEIIGISIDSLSKKTNRKIGRNSQGGRTILEADLERIVTRIRERKPSIKIKFNIVVNTYNWNEQIVGRLISYTPDRIKVFKQMPFGSNIGISNDMFVEFLKQNLTTWHGLCVEDNEDMIESYLMIDPSGCFFQNGQHHVYKYSQPIYEVGLKSSLAEIKFDHNKFTKRYGAYSNAK